MEAVGGALGAIWLPQMAKTTKLLKFVWRLGCPKWRKAWYLRMQTHIRSYAFFVWKNMIFRKALFYLGESIIFEKKMVRGSPRRTLEGSQHLVFFMIFIWFLVLCFFWFCVLYSVSFLMASEMPKPSKTMCFTIRNAISHATEKSSFWHAFWRSKISPGPQIASLLDLIFC